MNSRSICALFKEIIYKYMTCTSTGPVTLCIKTVTFLAFVVLPKYDHHYCVYFVTPYLLSSKPVSLATLPHLYI